MMTCSIFTTRGLALFILPDSSNQTCQAHLPPCTGRQIYDHHIFSIFLNPRPVIAKARVIADKRVSQASQGGCKRSGNKASIDQKDIVILFGISHRNLRTGQRDYDRKMLHWSTIKDIRNQC